MDKMPNILEIIRYYAVENIRLNIFIAMNNEVSKLDHINVAFFIIKYFEIFQ